MIIERGVGYLMARDQVDSMTAFNRLRRAARDTQTKIGDVPNGWCRPAGCRPRQRASTAQLRSVCRTASRR